MPKKILICAHPDDEFIWFNPEIFDKIVIVFINRINDDEFNHRRWKAMANHPLKDKITCLNFLESGITNKRLNLSPEDKLKLFISNWHKLEKLIPNLISKFDEIYTHNQWGEFGHPEHVMINAVVNTFSAGKPVYCPEDVIESRDDKQKKYIVNTIDIFNFIKLREFYQQNNIWTFRNDYLPPPTIKYFKESQEDFKLRKTNIIIK